MRAKNKVNTMLSFRVNSNIDSLRNFFSGHMKNLI